MKKYFYQTNMKIKDNNLCQLEDYCQIFNTLSINNQLLIVSKNSILNSIKILVIQINIIK